ncbi:hypothetical protein AAOGI_32990 [Agarivorans albus]
MTNNFNRKAFFGAALCTLLSTQLYAQVAPIWEDYLDAKQHAEPLPIPDFSYAGFDRGNSAIPSPNWTVFNVKDYGAIPNDGRDDLNAIKAAINAAQKQKNGAVVYFPKGRYLLSENTGVYSSLLSITASNLILRGEGDGNSGTELFFKHHLETATPQNKWTVPAMLSINGSTASYQGKYATRITGDAAIGADTINVADSSMLQVGDHIYLALNDLSAVTNHAVSPYYVENNWTSFKQGQFRKELHQIKSINGRKLTLAEPILMPIDSAYNWEVKTMQLGSHFGIENMRLTGAWTEKFVHHKDYIHDGGWKAINMGKYTHSWLKDVRFTNWNSTLNISSSIASSVINVTLDGHRGHSGIHIQNSYGVLVSHSHDKTDGGMFHAQGVSSHSAGIVFHRNSWPQDTSFDAHASFPHATLFDRVDGGFSYSSGGNGGDASSQPNHMEDLVFWNFKDLGKKSGEPVVWWRTNSIYTRFLLPKLIGWHGVLPSFIDSELGLNQSYGEKVSPESLYEAQLQHRLGVTPGWLQDINAKYAGIDTPDLVVDSLNFASDIKTLPKAKIYTFELEYQASISRDVSIELWRNGSWLANAKKTVAAGSGKVQLNLSFDSELVAGAGYLLKSSIRPVGTNWQSNIALVQKNNIEVVEQPYTVLPVSGWKNLKIRHSAKCLDVAAGATNNGSQYHQWSCNQANVNQQFAFEDVGAGWYRIRAKVSNKCVDLSRGEQADGAIIQQYSCIDGNQNQMWQLIDKGDGWFNLMSKQSRKCLDVSARSVENKALIHQWQCKDNDNHNQQFTSY